MEGDEGGVSWRGWDSFRWDRRSWVINPRKEVIQPQLPLRLPCYDFTPIISPTLTTCVPCGFAVAASGVANFGGVTGGVYKARERIHRGMLTHGY